MRQKRLRLQKQRGGKKDPKEKDGKKSKINKSIKGGRVNDKHKGPPGQDPLLVVFSLNPSIVFCIYPA